MEDVDPRVGDWSERHVGARSGGVESGEVL